VGPKAGLDGFEKFRPVPEFDPQTSHPVASPYIHCAVPAHHKFGIRKNESSIYPLNVLFHMSYMYELLYADTRIWKV